MALRERPVAPGLKTGGRQEAERLLELARSLEMEGPGYAAWRKRMQQLQAAPELETLAGEAELDHMALRLRALWLGCAHQFSDILLKSPLHSDPKCLPSGEPIDFTYERNVRPHLLEEKTRAYRPAPPGWQAEHVHFRSGMGAIATFLLALNTMWKPGPDKPLSLGMWGGYYETHFLLGGVAHAHFNWRRHHSQDTMHTALLEGEHDALLLETVAYDWELEVFDLEAFLESWSQRSSQRVKVLVLDTTLTGLAFPMEDLLAGLADDPPLMVVQITSGLKLDQQGLELANVGLLSYYSPGGEASQAAALTRKLRTVAGTALSFAELCELDVPFFATRQSLAEHSEAVFANNAWLAAQLERGRGGLFWKVAHPSLGPAAELAWAKAPFVVLHLQEDRLENHGLLLSVISQEVRRRELPFAMGSSFGFRGHRFETIIPSIRDRQGLFKVALGSRSGPALEGIAELLLELADRPDFASLRARYPDLRAVDMDTLEL
ncbi:MAG: hypothetical protein AB7S38_27305 [Vulcanimicrobiota bacterium]